MRVYRRMKELGALDHDDVRQLHLRASGRRPSRSTSAIQPATSSSSTIAMPRRSRRDEVPEYMVPRGRPAAGGRRRALDALAPAADRATGRPAAAGRPVTPPGVFVRTGRSGSLPATSARGRRRAARASPRPRRASRPVGARTRITIRSPACSLLASITVGIRCVPVEEDRLGAGGERLLCRLADHEAQCASVAALDVDRDLVRRPWRRTCRGRGRAAASAWPGTGRGLRRSLRPWP